MDDLIQKRDPASSLYERPFRKWKCAGGADGQACARGATCEGVCGAASACEPIKKDDRWYCSREGSLGGPCKEGPLPDGQCACKETPCVPELSLRALRGRTVRWAVLLILGIVALGVGGSWTYSFINPGVVAEHHITIEECEICHSEVMSNGFAHWAAAFVDSVDVGMENQRCVNCHELGSSPQTAHGFTDGELVLKTDKAQKKESNHKKIPAYFTQDEIACATCHKEHQADRKINLQSCNSCHTDNATMFPETHPDFNSFPYKRRTALIFDHTSHFDRHFEKEMERAPEFCLDCHRTDSEGRRMETKPYEKTCQSCHDKQVTGEERAIGPKGIPFFVLPGIDVETLVEKNINIGQWPLFAEGKITPLMQDLLLGNSFDGVENKDLLDLQSADEQKLNQTFEMAWAIKSFLYDLTQVGPEKTLSEILEQRLGRKPTHNELSSLSGSLPASVLKEAITDWFPNLYEEIPAYRDGNALPSIAYEKVAEVSVALVPSMKNVESKAFSDERMFDDEGGILGAEDEGIFGDEEDSILAEDDEGILADEEDEILGDEDEGIFDNEEEGILAEDEDSILGGDEIESDLDTPNDAIVSNEDHSPVKIDAEQWSKLGGWYSADFALLYRPTGHGDRVVKELINLGGLISKDAFMQLSADKAQGQCAKCHARSQTKEGGLQLEWLQTVKVMEPQQLTTFRHDPHFATQTDEGCGACHAIGDYSKEYQEAFTQTATSHFKSNFEPMEIEQCEECHNEKTSLNKCDTCHRYHPGGVDVKPLRSKFSISKQ